MQEEEATVQRVVQRLREIRQERSVSLYRLAKDSGLSPSGLRHMENGDVTPTLAFLLRVARFLQADLSTILNDAVMPTADDDGTSSRRE